jgi:glutathione S-transferase
MMKLYYLEIFAKGEPIRMMLTLAKIPFEDIRVNGEMMKTLREEGKLEYGQVPMLELEDGTKLTQTSAIINYVSTVYGLDPVGPLEVYRG